MTRVLVLQGPNLNLVGTWKPGSRYTFAARLGVATGTPYTDIVGQLVRRNYNPRTHLWNGDRSGDDISGRGARPEDDGEDEVGRHADADEESEHPDTHEDGRGQRPRCFGGLVAR